MNKYSHGGHTVTVAKNGAIQVKPGDTIGKYSMAIHKDFKHLNMFGRLDPSSGGKKVKPLANVNLISVGETIYHIPSFGGPANGPCPVNPPPTTPAVPQPSPVGVVNLTVQHGNKRPTASGSAMYESTFHLSGALSGTFTGSIYPEDMNNYGRIADGTYELSLTFHNKKGIPAEADLIIKTQGDLRPALTVNYGQRIPIISDSPGIISSANINIHNGFNGNRGSKGCLTIKPSDWDRLIKLFLTRYTNLSDWYKPDWRGLKLGSLIVKV
jgi:hypothetical protein